MPRKYFTLAAAVVAIALGGAGYWLGRNVLHIQVANVPIFSKGTTAFNTNIVNSASDISNTNSDVVSEKTYPLSEGCYSDFPIMGNASGEKLAISDLVVLIQKSAKGFLVPKDFTDEIQSRLDSNWDMTTFCVNAHDFSRPIIYFSMVYTGKEDIPTRLRAPATSRTGAPAIIGYWDAEQSRETYTGIHFSEPVRVLGMGDTTFFGRLEYQHILSTSLGASKGTIIGYTGGGDGPFGWSMRVSFDPSKNSLSVLQYCSYDSSGEAQVNKCSSTIQ